MEHIFPASLLKNLALTYLVTGTLLFLAEFLFPRGRFLFRRPEWRLDVAYLVLMVTVVVGLLQVTGLALAQLPWDRAPGLAAVRAKIGGLPIGGQAILAFVVLDFVAYWQHRLAHHPLLWPLHAIHHCSRHIDCLSGSRFHPLDLVLKRVVLSLPALLLGFSGAAVASFALPSLFFTYLTHANVPWTYGPLGRWVVSPAFHRWHHALAPGIPPRNFGGLLSVWDRCFGTAHFAPARENFEVGTATPVPSSFWGQMLFPFRPDRP